VEQEDLFNMAKSYAAVLRLARGSHD